jgi:integrase
LSTRKLVAKYRVGKTWYLRYAKSIGLPRKSTGVTDAKLAEAIRSTEEQRFLLARFGIRAKVPSKIRLRDFLKIFAADRQSSGCSRSTLEVYRCAYNAFGLSLGKNLYLHQITAHDFERYIQHLRSAKRKPKTINTYVIALVTAFRWARRQGYILEVPEFTKPKTVRHPPRYLRPQDYLKLIDAITDDEFRDVINFYLLTGIRRGEGLLVRVQSHIDLNLGIIRLPQQKQGTYKAFPITDELRPILKRMVARADSEGKIIHCGPGNLSARFRLYAARAGLPPNTTFHVLRHTFATWLGAQGVALTTLQALGGWSSASTVEKYAHPFEDHLHEALSRLKLPK